jgi:DNA adenine methylase
VRNRSERYWPRKSDSCPRSIKPFLKWAGGKRWLASTIAGLLTAKGRYFEPFLGSGAVFFSLGSRNAVLSDVNHDLISTFVAIRDDASAVIRQLSQLCVNKRTFGQFQKRVPNDAVDQAVRFLYLNRTAFNGLYRVNLRGQFNVPFGCKEGTRLCDAEGLRACSRALQAATLHSVDFRVPLANVRPLDCLYIDPPYTVKHDQNGFRRYNERIFSWKDQLDLAHMLNQLASEGTKIIVSNSFHQEVAALYDRRNFHLVVLERQSRMAADTNHRGLCRELLLVSDSISEPSKLATVFNQVVGSRVLS